MTPETAPAPPLARTVALAYAWGAGVAFVGSLAYFLYCYGILFGGEQAGTADLKVRLYRGESAAWPVVRALVINTLLFAAFGVHHSVMARTRAKRWLARLIPTALERATYVWVASLLFFATCWWWQDLPGGLYRIEGWPAAPCVLLQLAGIALALRSAKSINVFDLAGIDQVRRRASDPHDGPAAHEMGRLETTGPYRLVRHPIYLGTLLLMVATPDMTTDRLLFSGLSLAYLLVGIALEERSLGAEFGPAYDEYRRQVRWKLLPGIY